MSDKSIDHFIDSDGLDSEREKSIGQHIGYRYDVNLAPDMERITPFLKKYLEVMGWQDLNWLEDVHMGYEESQPAVFDRNINGWVTIPDDIVLPDNQQDRDMIARELLVKFQMSGQSSDGGSDEGLRQVLNAVDYSFLPSPRGRGAGGEGSCH